VRMYPLQSLRQAVIIIQEILAAGCARTLRHPCRSRGPGGFQERAPRLWPGHRRDRDESDGRLPVARQHDIIARFRAADEFGQQALGFCHGDTHERPFRLLTGNKWTN